MCAGGDKRGTNGNQWASYGSTPRAVFRSISVGPVNTAIAKPIIERGHYLHTMPGGTKLSFGAYLGARLLGAMTFGVGPFNAHRLVEGASSYDCLTLTRLWLSDELPRNSESRVLSIILRALRRDTSIKFVLSYADPSQGHVGTIYQATNWLYTGLSEATPLYDIGDGKLYHSRSLSTAIGTHSLKYLADNGVRFLQVAQSAKHRCGYFLDPKWRSRLRVPVLPYPKKVVADENC